MDPKTGQTANLLLSAVYAPDKDESGKVISESERAVTDDPREMAYIGGERQEFALDLIVYQQ